MVHRQAVQMQIATVSSKQLPSQRDQERVYSEPKANNHDLGRQSHVAPDMFQYGKSCVNFFILTGQQQESSKSRYFPNSSVGTSGRQITVEWRKVWFSHMLSDDSLSGN